MTPRCPHGGDPLERVHRRHAHLHAHGRPRRSLQLRLFAWSGITILLTGMMVGAVAWVTSSGPSSWQRTMQGALLITSRRFAEVWSDDRARAALASEIATELQVGVTTRDPGGQVLESFGPTTTRSFAIIPVESGGGRAGSVEVFARRFRRPQEVFAPLLVALCVLWGLSGLLARRLARPLADLAATVDAIGRGELDRRTRVARHAPREVARVADAIDDMASRIQRQMADQRELLAAVSHEVRSPLARIRLLVELARPQRASADADLADADLPDLPDAAVAADADRSPAPLAPPPSDADRDHALAEIDREVEEIDALVGSLLASSRLDFGTIAPREVDGVALARDALLRAGLPARLLEAGPEVPAVRADPTLLARALANLLDNARTHAGGVARLRVSVDGGGVRFDVEDDALVVGADAEKLFQAFHRKPGTHGALGLGLAIVSRIAEAHGGAAYAEDREGGGARVGLWIPRADRRAPGAPGPVASGA